MEDSPNGQTEIVDDPMPQERAYLNSIPHDEHCCTGCRRILIETALGARAQQSMFALVRAKGIGGMMSLLRGARG